MREEYEDMLNEMEEIEERKIEKEQNISNLTKEWQDAYNAALNDEDDEVVRAACTICGTLIPIYNLDEHEQHCNKDDCFQLVGIFDIIKLKDLFHAIAEEREKQGIKGEIFRYEDISPERGYGIIGIGQIADDDEDDEEDNEDEDDNSSDEEEEEDSSSSDDDDDEFEEDWISDEKNQKMSLKEDKKLRSN
ncbi:MAG: hypothetical protein EZS28_009547 [Streblomastix strix]|uniref:Uncharacterized protein n=1 Tax=Streblomastix strix TaxID=222440 RepID=A0A5J4WKV0_9EUKA|nr:MAG: hypothetical protein EZS28_009547 [Streblomastix strix]